MKIDVHWHYMPEEYLQVIRREDNPWPTSAVRDEQGREWLSGGAFRHPLDAELYSPEAQLAEMDRRGIDLVAVSPAPHLFAYEQPVERAALLHRMVNDRIADLMAAYPGRYAGLAAVPLQDAALAVAELERAMLEKSCAAPRSARTSAGATSTSRSCGRFSGARPSWARSSSCIPARCSARTGCAATTSPT